jgi:hypothetical protein
MNYFITTESRIGSKVAEAYKRDTGRAGRHRDVDWETNA